LQLHTLFCTSTPCFAAPHPVLQFYTLFCISTPWSTGYRWSFRSYHFLMLHLVDVACLGVNGGKGGEGAWAELEKIRSKLLPISSLKTPKTLWIWCDFIAVHKLNGDIIIQESNTCRELSSVSQMKHTAHTHTHTASRVKHDWNVHTKILTCAQHVHLHVIVVHSYSSNLQMSTLNVSVQSSTLVLKYQCRYCHILNSQSHASVCSPTHVLILLFSYSLRVEFYWQPIQ